MIGLGQVRWFKPYHGGKGMLPAWGCRPKLSQLIERARSVSFGLPLSSPAGPFSCVEVCMKRVTLRKLQWPEWNQADIHLEDNETIVGVFQPQPYSYTFPGGGGGSYHNPDFIFVVIAKEVT